MPANSPQGVAEWRGMLTDKSFPILAITKKNIERLIGNSQLSITQYAGPVLYDAGFTAQVFRQVNPQRDKAGRRPLTTLDNALSHLGQEAFKVFLKKTDVFEQLELPQANRQGYLRVMQQACHAGLQARDWSQQRNVMQPEETQVAALLQSVTELMLWRYGDDVMPRIEQLAYVEKQPYSESAKQVLGCSMKQLGYALAEAWALPEMALDGLSERADDFTLATGVSLASEVARRAELNWYGEAMQQLIERIARYKGKQEGEIERRLHLNAVAFSDEMLAHGFKSPSRLLPMLADDQYVYDEFRLSAVADNTVDMRTEAAADKIPGAKAGPSAEPGVKPGKPVVAKKAAAITPGKPAAAKRAEAIRAKLATKAAQQKASPHVNAAAEVNTKAEPNTHQKPAEKNTEKSTAIRPELAAAIKQFNQMVAEAAPAHDLIEHAVGMCLLCGVQRARFLIKLPGKDILASRYSVEDEGLDAMMNFKISIAKPNLFTRIMESSRNLFLNESNRGKYWKLIPDQVKLVLGVKQFFMMSIFVKNHAMGLMYADKVHGELTQAEFKQFVGICNLLSKAIVQSAQNKHRQSAAANV